MGSGVVKFGVIERRRLTEKRLGIHFEKIFRGRSGKGLGFRRNFVFYKRLFLEIEYKIIFLGIFVEFSLLLNFFKNFFLLTLFFFSFFDE